MTLHLQPEKQPFLPAILLITSKSTYKIIIYLTKEEICGESRQKSLRRRLGQ
jgi:hypothetical protein